MRREEEDAIKRQKREATRAIHSSRPKAVELLSKLCCDYVEVNVNGGVDVIGNRREAD
jgi:hypothetical protein